MKKTILILSLLIFTIYISLFAYGIDQTSFFQEFRTLKQVCYIIDKKYYQKIEPKKMIETMITSYLKTLDPYSTFIPPKNTEQFDINIKGKYGGIGAIIGESKYHLITIIEPFENSPSNKAGLIPNDILIKIDNKFTKGMKTSEVADILRDDPGKEVNIIVKRKNIKKLIPFSFKREIIKVNSAKCEIINNSIGYIKIKSFQEDTLKQILKTCNKFKEMSVSEIIVDLRNDPGGLLRMAVELSNLFFKKGTLIVSIKGRDKKTERNFYTMNEPIFPTIPLIVLINKHSASASEIFAGAVKDHKRGVLIGERSFGKGSVQNTFPLGEKGDKGILKLTIAKYFTPSGICIHGTGIEPDIKAELTKLPEKDINKIYEKYKDTSETSLSLTTKEVEFINNIDEKYIKNNTASKKEVEKFKIYAKKEIAYIKKRNKEMWHELIKYDNQIQTAIKLINAKRILENKE